MIMVDEKERMPEGKTPISRTFAFWNAFHWATKKQTKLRETGGFAADNPGERTRLPIFISRLKWGKCPPRAHRPSSSGLKVDKPPQYSSQVGGHAMPAAEAGFVASSLLNNETPRTLRSQ